MKVQIIDLRGIRNPKKDERLANKTNNNIKVKQIKFETEPKKAWTKLKNKCCKQQQKKF